MEKFKTLVGVGFVLIILAFFQPEALLFLTLVLFPSYSHHVYSQHSFNALGGLCHYTENMRKYGKRKYNFFKKYLNFSVPSALLEHDVENSQLKTWDDVEAASEKYTEVIHKRIATKTNIEPIKPGGNISLYLTRWGMAKARTWDEVEKESQIYTQAVHKKVAKTSM